MALVAQPGYDDSHRAFLQVLLAKSTITFEDAKPILAAIFTAQGSMTTRKSLYDPVN